jgi:hypothetical protein
MFSKPLNQLIIVNGLDFGKGSTLDHLKQNGNSALTYDATLAVEPDFGGYVALANIQVNIDDVAATGIDSLQHNVGIGPCGPITRRFVML